MRKNKVGVARLSWWQSDISKQSSLFCVPFCLPQFPTNWTTGSKQVLLIIVFVFCCSGWWKHLGYLEISIILQREEASWNKQRAVISALAGPSDTSQQVTEGSVSQSFFDWVRNGCNVFRPQPTTKGTLNSSMKNKLHLGRGKSIWIPLAGRGERDRKGWRETYRWKEVFP